MSESTMLTAVRTGDWLDAQHFPPLSWAVHGILPEGFGLFTGAPKTGKSWAAFGIALAVASGGRALGNVDVGDPRPVLMLALEDGDRRLQGRARHLLGEGQPIPADLHYATSVHPNQVTALIEEWLGVYGDRAPLVVLDTLGKVMPAALPGEGAYQRDYRVGSALKRLVDAHPGACLMVVHHTNKRGGDGDWMDSTSGTNGLNGAADWTATLVRTRNESKGTLKVTGRDVPENEYAVTSDNGRWTLDGTTLAEAARAAAQRSQIENLGDRSAEIVAFVANKMRPVSPKEVETEFTMPDARRYLARLVESGRLAKSGRGQYMSVPTDPSVPSDGLLGQEWDTGTVGTPPLGGGW
ncbi:AAA family ATPase [Demequina sp.]|uniref:AAA family ATPase n=1 Tax=Demequina sp. TaxID=2050685 RepID=UPI003A854465